MDIQREIRERTLPLDEALEEFKELELNIARQMAREKKDT